jgi:iron-sulfur cluster assembly accessory protein|tara:strand:- start:3796 stop:4224 length:429 start_codon:yes stop_codon:yes gene_type:complete
MWESPFSSSLYDLMLEAEFAIKSSSAMTDIQLSPNEVVLTERAAKRINRILSKEDPGTVLRIAVAGGGCSGFQYEYNFVKETPTEDDLVLSRDGATVYIDSMSLEFMGGAEIDFVDDLIGQSFQIKNPNAVASCGCGTSFAV